MIHLDPLLAKLDHPPFDRLARICLDVTGAIDGVRTIALGGTTVSGNAHTESEKKTIERVPLSEPADLELRVRWVIRVTAERRLATPRVEEAYEASPLGYGGSLHAFDAELDRRLVAAEELMGPQVVTDVSASLIPPARGSSGACFARARFQGVMVVPHVIEVKLYDSDLEGADDPRWRVLRSWAVRAAQGRGCTIVPGR